MSEEGMLKDGHIKGGCEKKMRVFRRGNWHGNF